MRRERIAFEADLGKIQHHPSANQLPVHSAIKAELQARTT
jgi:hypothetical protein